MIKVPRILPRVISALTCAVVVCSTPAAAVVSTGNVILIVIDGLRASEAFDDPDYNYIPLMGGRLAHLGTVCRACDNLGFTVTVPGHVAVASGRYQDLPNDGSVRSAFAHLWEYYRSATGVPVRDALVVATKQKLACLSYSTSPFFGPADSAATFAGYGNDAAAVSKFVNELWLHHPSVGFLSLGDVDAAGHSGSWELYTSKILQADALVSYLWDWLQHDPQYRDRTAFVVTSDHGRHDDAHGSWTDHGDGCPGCRRISLLCVGHDFLRDRVSWQPCEQADICVTLGSLLNVPTPEAGGRVLDEILRGPAGLFSTPEITGAPAVRHEDGRLVVTTPIRGDRCSFRLFDVTGRLLRQDEIFPERPLSFAPQASGIFFYLLDGEDGSTHGKVAVAR